MSWTALFHGLYNHLKDEETVDISISIPNTAIFNHIKPLKFYYTPSDTPGIVKCRKFNANSESTNAKLLRSFLESPHDGIVAAMIYYDDSRSNIIPELKIMYLDELQIKDVLMNSSKSSIIPPNEWILQQYISISPQNRANAYVSEKIDADNYIMKKVTNVHVIDRHSSNTDAYVTVDGMGTPHVKVEDLSDGVADMITTLSSICYSCLSKELNIPIDISVDDFSVVFYFCLSSSGELNLLWCLLSLSEKMKKKIKHMPSPAGGSTKEVVKTSYDFTNQRNIRDDDELSELSISTIVSNSNNNLTVRSDNNNNDIKIDQQIPWLPEGVDADDKESVSRVATLNLTPTNSGTSTTPTVKNNVMATSYGDNIRNKKEVLSIDIGASPAVSITSRTVTPVSARRTVIEHACFHSSNMSSMSAKFECLYGVSNIITGYHPTSLLKCIKMEYSSKIVTYSDLLEVFWECCSQYNDVIYFYTNDQKLLAEASAYRYSTGKGKRRLTFEMLVEAGPDSVVKSVASKNGNNKPNKMSESSPGGWEKAFRVAAEVDQGLHDGGKSFVPIPPSSSNHVNRSRPNSSSSGVNERGRKLVNTSHTLYDEFSNNATSDVYEQPVMHTERTISLAKPRVTAVQEFAAAREYTVANSNNTIDLVPKRVTAPKVTNNKKKTYIQNVFAEDQSQKYSRTKKSSTKKMKKASVNMLPWVYPNQTDYSQQHNEREAKKLASNMIIRKIYIRKSPVKTSSYHSKADSYGHSISPTQKVPSRPTSSKQTSKVANHRTARDTTFQLEMGRLTTPWRVVTKSSADVKRELVARPKTPSTHPTGLTEDLFDILLSMINTVSVKLSSCMVSSIPLADKHHADIFAVNSGKRVMNVESKVDLNTKRINQIMHLVTKGYVPIPTSSTSEDASKDVGYDNSNNSDSSSNAGNIYASRSNSPYKSPSKDDKKDGVLADIYKSLSFSEKSLVELLQLLACTPNHRPVGDLNTVILWLLSFQASKSTNADVVSAHRTNLLLSSFDDFVNVVKKDLLELTDIDKTRGPSAGKDRQSKLQKVEDLRKWYEMRDVAIAPTDRIDGDFMEADSMVSSITDHGNSSYFTEAASRSISKANAPTMHTFSTANNTNMNKHLGNASSITSNLLGVDTSPKKYTNSNGRRFTGDPIRSLGYSSATADNNNSSKNSQYSKNGNVSTNGESAGSTRPVRIHLGCDAYTKGCLMTDLAKTKLLAVPNGSTLASSCRTQLFVMESCEVSSKNDAIADDVVDESFKIMKRYESFNSTYNFNDSAVGENVILDNLDELMMSPAPTVNVESTMSRVTNGFEDGIEAEEVLQKECLFHRLAPAINTDQRNLLLASIMSDLSRTIILCVSVLLKYTSAGKIITMEDVVNLFCTPVARVIGIKQLRLLLTWCNANRRDTNNFRPASQLSNLDLALQRIYSFWPQVNVSVLNPNQSASYSNKPLSKCSVKLLWNDKYTINKSFNEPHAFEPNINNI